MTTAPPPVKNTPAAATGAHKFRVTWPMLLGWLTMLSLLAPMVAPYVTGERKLDAAGICALLAAVVGALNHSPLGTPGGGLPKVPPAVTLLLVLLAGLTLSACGGGWASIPRHTIELGATAVQHVDDSARELVVTRCTPSAQAAAPGAERDRAVDACVAALHLEHADEAIQQADRTLRTAQAVVDAGEHEEAKRSLWHDVAPCVLAAVHEVLDIATAAGVDIPPDIRAGIEDLTPLAGTCRAPPSLATAAGGAS